MSEPMQTNSLKEHRPNWKRTRMRSGAVLAGLLLTLLVAAACATTAVPEGDAADDFQLTLFGNENYGKGSTLSLSDPELKGRPVVINFWYPSCPPCRLEMPDLQAASLKYAPDGVVFVGIQSLVLDTVAEGQQFIDEFGITYAVGPDTTGDILVDYKVVGFPSTYFLDENHQVVRSWAGVLNGEKLDELIAEILN